MWRAKCVCSLRCYSPIKQKKNIYWRSYKICIRESVLDVLTSDWLEFKQGFWLDCADFKADQSDVNDVRFSLNNFMIFHDKVCHGVRYLLNIFC